MLLLFRGYVEPLPPSSAARRPAPLPPGSLGCVWDPLGTSFPAPAPAALATVRAPTPLSASRMRAETTLCASCLMSFADRAHSVSLLNHRNT